MNNILQFLALTAAGGRGQKICLEQPTGMATVTTTLYDLIATIRAVVGREEEPMIVAAAVHMLQSGHAAFVGDNGKARRTINVQALPGTISCYALRCGTLWDVGGVLQRVPPGQ